MANARAIGHQTEASAKALWLEATAYAVSEFSGARVECSITGKRAAAPVASTPTMRPFEPTNARISLRVTRPETSVTAEATMTSTPSQQRGLCTATWNKSGRTIHDSTESAKKSGTTATQRRFAYLAVRSCTGPSV